MPPKTFVVAGAGVVGLSIARTAARRGVDVLVLEQNALVGQETSARNSEVVHGRWCGTHKLNLFLIPAARPIIVGIILC